MPQIIVTADHGAAFGEGAVTLRERVNVADFESQHFATQLLERLGWAVEDADQAEQEPNTGDRRRRLTDRRREMGEEPERLVHEDGDETERLAQEAEALTAPSPA